MDELTRCLGCNTSDESSGPFNHSSGPFNQSWGSSNHSWEPSNHSWIPSATTCSPTAPESFTSSKIFHAIVYVMYVGVFVVALAGNGLVCWVVHATPRMKTVTNYFIVNLAVGDILLTVFCVPFSFLSTLVLRQWVFGETMCRLVNYSQAVSVLVSAYTLLAISADRYMAITRPLQPRLGRLAARAVLVAVWLGALATAAPIPVVSTLSRPTEWHEVCRIDICLEQWPSPEQNAQYTCALLVLQFALPLVTLVGTYARIACIVWGGRPPGEAESTRDSRIQNSKRKMIKMMVTVVAVFTICWLPLNIFILLWTVHESAEEWSTWPGIPYVWFASHWLAMSHACYNPIIYCYMNTRYRRGFKQVLGDLLCIKSEANRSYHHRSSLCDGVPMSEMIRVNGSTLQRRGTSLRADTCSCNRRAACGDKTCACTHSMRAHTAFRTSSAPARAISVRSTLNM